MNQLEILGSLARVALAIAVGCGYWLAVRALFPRFTDRSSQRWRKPIWDFVIGGLIGAVLVLIGRQLNQADPNSSLQWAGKIWVGLTILLGIVGLSGLATVLGQGLKVSGEDRNSWKATLRGGVVLGLLTGLPTISDWVVVPLFIAGGIGNAVMTLVTRSGPNRRDGRQREPGRTPPRDAMPEKERDGGVRKNRPPRRGRNPRPREPRDKGDASNSPS